MPFNPSFQTLPSFYRTDSMKGDLKPENIILFNETENPTEKGILQITDLGLGRFHGFGSRSKDDPRRIAGSSTYLPPEMALNIPISRAYDIWSLGCVFLEFFTWMVEGCEAVKEFSNTRLLMTEDDVMDDVFFTHTAGQAEVRDGVIRWVQRLRQHERCSKMIHDLLDLTMNRMLRIGTRERISSTELKAKLTQILQRSRIDSRQQTLDYVLGPIRSVEDKPGNEESSNSFFYKGQGLGTRE